MRFHTDVLERDDFHAALRSTGLMAQGVMIDGFGEHGSRKRARAFEVHLDAMPGRDRFGAARRYTNSGTMGAGANRAATYDEWGIWLAALYERDPEMIAGHYRDREHFHAVTSGNYRATAAA